MKKILFLLFLTPLLLTAAVKSGDLAPELKLRNIKGAGFSVLPVRNAPENSYKVLVFAQLRTPMGRETAILLDALEKRYRKSNLQVALVSLDEPGEAQRFIAAFPDLSYTLLRDESFESSTAYLGVAPMLPKGFIIDYTGTVIWDGEGGDIPELMENIYSGVFSPDRQKKIAPQLEELRALLRGGDDRRAAELTDAILKIDPNEPSALRIRIFMLESTDRIDQAWQLLERQIGLTPKLRRNYLTAFELASRYPGFRAGALALLPKYMENFPPDDNYDGAIIWTLLTRYEFNFEAVKGASELLKRMNFPSQSFGELSGRALLAYRSGNLTAAIEFQARAANVADTPERREEAKILLGFYENMKRLEN